jgi:hypothetical protein
MDFDLNLANIVQSIRIAKQQGATFRTGYPSMRSPHPSVKA